MEFAHCFRLRVRNVYNVLAAGPKGAKSTKYTESRISVVVVVVALLLPLFVRLRLRLRLKLPFYFSEPMVYCPVNWQRETDRDRRKTDMAGEKGIE